LEPGQINYSLQDVINGRESNLETTMPLFVSAFDNFWPLKADADCQTLSFSASFYQIRLSKNH
jgi:hypothetical protein